MFVFYGAGMPVDFHPAEMVSPFRGSISLPFPTG